MADIVTHDDQTAQPGEALAYITAKNAKPGVAPVAAAPTDVASETADAPADAAPEPIAATPAVEEDPETHEPLEKPTRADKRIKRLWSEKEAEKARAQRLEDELAELRAQIAEGRSAAPSRADVAAPSTAAPDDELTAAAQARIRPRPNRADIGTKYATYEDYVEDAAIWGGELASEKRALLADQQQAETRLTQQQADFRAAQDLARAEYPDFDEVTRTDLPANQAMFDAIVNAPKDLSAFAHYWLVKHPEETRRIAALPPGPALVAMGEVLATVKAERAAKTASASPDPKPRSRAPAPLTPVPHRTASPTRAEDIAVAQGSPVDFIRMRNEEVGRRGRL